MTPRPYKPPTNRDRAQWARNALAAYTAETYGGRTPEQLGAPTVAAAIDDAARFDHDSDAVTMLGDMLADLRHYAAAVGLDYADQDERGARHYGEEEGAAWDEITE